MKVYTILGTHTASSGDAFPFIAKVAETVWNNMYEKLSPNPTPKYIPMPPLTFLEDNDTPMIVKIKEANDIAIRL